MPHPRTIFVRPAPGIRIADPQTGDYLPERGATVPRSGFWLRRLEDGDVTEGPGPAADAPRPGPQPDAPEPGKAGKGKKE
jgi:hypothetical protein